MTDIEKQKILVCGDVEGRFEALYKRVQNINKKSGPFDMLLCVGNFFGINNKEFIPYKIGEKKVPIVTYILGPNQEDHLGYYPRNEFDSELCNNVYYLGKRGLFTDSKGVKIAYISGLSNETDSKAWTYSTKEISELCDACVRGNPSFRGVDILLSSQWPSNIIAEQAQVTLNINMPSDLISYSCMKLKPRYVFSGLEGISYERTPFRCPNLSDNDTTIESATRFIGLARVGNSNKDKWIFALSLTPVEKMKLGELLQKTIDETPCPFNFYELESKIFKNKRKISLPNQYFYDMNTMPEDDRKNKKGIKKPRVAFDQSKCWFCLASPSIEKHLIISVGTNVYLALAKGGLVKEHFLICPIEHTQSSISQPEEVIHEINEFKEALHKFYGRKGETPVVFERNYKTSHMQMQVVPIPKNANRELKEIFLDESEAHGFKLEILDNGKQISQVIPPRVPYFSVELPDLTILYTKIQASKNFPINFAREVLASGPVLNLSDRVNWKECILPKDVEEELAKNIRTEFEPYDFTVSL